MHEVCDLRRLHGALVLDHCCLSGAEACGERVRPDVTFGLGSIRAIGSRTTGCRSRPTLPTTSLSSLAVVSSWRHRHSSPAGVSVSTRLRIGSAKWTGFTKVPP